MVKRRDQPPCRSEAGSSSSDSSDGEHHAGAATHKQQRASTAAACPPNETETAWLSEDSDEQETEATEAPVVAKEEDAFYDAELDEKDQAWVEKRRQGRRSDAILSCPGCLTSVCLDCQQHAEREGHFRAMFVINCRRASFPTSLCSNTPGPSLEHQKPSLS